MLTELSTGLTVLNIILLHGSGSDCILLILRIRTWSLAVHRSVGSSRKPFIVLHFLSWFFLSTLWCDSSLCSSSSSRRILDNQETSHIYRISHLLGCRLCVGRELLPDLCTGSGRSPPLSHCCWCLITFTLCSWRLVPEKTSWLCLSLDRCGSGNACRRADVHLVGSQLQSEMHSIEELRFELVLSAASSIQRKAERTLLTVVANIKQ